MGSIESIKLMEDPIELQGSLSNRAELNKPFPMSLEREELLSNCWQVLKSDMHSIAISEHVPILIVAIYNHLMMILSYGEFFAMIK